MSQKALYPELRLLALFLLFTYKSMFSEVDCSKACKQNLSLLIHIDISSTLKFLFFLSLN